MRLVNTKAHGIYDYLMGLTLIASPYIFDFSTDSTPQKICALAGMWIWIMSVITKYEFSMSKILTLRLHLAVDVLIGIFLAASPWVFGFDTVVYKPHVVFGLTLIIVSLLTDRTLFNEVLMSLEQTKSSKQMIKSNRGKRYNGHSFSTLIHSDKESLSKYAFRKTHKHY